MAHQYNCAGHDLSQLIRSACKATSPVVGIPLPNRAPLIFHRLKLYRALKGVEIDRIGVTDRSLVVEGHSGPHVRTRMVMHSIPRHRARELLHKLKDRAMNKPIRVKPDALANVTGESGTRTDWPAFRANNDRFLCTVPVCSGDPVEDCKTIRRLNVTHQPSGLVATFDQPYRIALLVADAYFLFIGDLEDAKDVKAKFATLPDSVRRWLRNPTDSPPPEVGEVMKKLKSKQTKKASTTTTRSVSNRKPSAVVVAPKRPVAPVRPSPQMNDVQALSRGAFEYVQPKLILSPAQFTETVCRLRAELDWMASKWSALANLTSSPCGIRTLDPTRLN